MDDEIYLDPNAPPEAPRARPGNPRLRLAALVAVAVLVAVVALIQHNRKDPPVRAAPPSGPQPQASRVVQNWPDQPGICNTRLEEPIVTSDALAEPVGAALLVSGAKPGLLDVDTGSIESLPGATPLTDQQYVSQTVAGSSALYSLIRDCQRRAVGTVVVNQIGQPQRPVAVGRTFYGLLSDGRGGVWGELYSGPPRVRPEAAVGTSLLRLDRAGQPIVIPPNLIPIGLYGTTLVAGTAPTPVRRSLVLFDLRTGHATNLGPSYGASVSGDQLIWTSSPCSDVDACPVHRYDLGTGGASVAAYHLPLEANFATAVISPDRQRVAFVLSRETPDPAYASNARGTPSDLAVLDLRNGVIEPVPNLELPPDSTPDKFTFSADGKWLVVGFTTATGTEVYSWRSGLSRPQKSPSV